MRAAVEALIGEVEADALFLPLEGAASAVACVSGGPDSLALLHLFAEWRGRRRSGPRIEVFTVDHRLRPSSRKEAEAVCRLAEDRYCLPAKILSFDGARPVTGIEEAAREARYELLATAALAAGARHLVLAHHRDDQAETVLMRLARGSSAYGLAAMKRLSRLGPLTLFRPFLDIPKARLAAVVAAAGLQAADDESNRDRRFLRTRLRELMPVLAEEGLDTARLAGFSLTMGRLAEAVDHYVDVLIGEAVVVEADRTGLRLEPFLAAPEEVRLRLLSRLVQSLGAAAYPPRMASLSGLERAFGRPEAFKRTLGGVVVAKKDGYATLQREPGRKANRSADRHRIRPAGTQFTFP